MKIQKIISSLVLTFTITAHAEPTKTNGFDMKNEPTLSETVKSETNLYTLIKPIGSDVVGLWVQERPEFSQIVGYSPMGHVFLHNPTGKEYAIFYPFRQAAKSYGSFDSLEAFEQNILKETGFSIFVLKPDFTEELIQAHGKLAHDEVFIATPYIMHDSNDTKHFSKGNIWVMLDLTNQFFN